MSAATDTLTLDTAHAVRFLQTVGRMPFGGMVKRPNARGLHAEPYTVGEILDYLDELARVLRRVADNTEAERAELQRYRTLIAGGRALLAELLPTVAS